MNSSGRLYRTDVRTHDSTLIAEYALDFTDVAIASTGEIYANTFTTLYRLDLETLAATPVFNLSGSANGLAADADGRLYISYLRRNVIDVVDPEALTVLPSIGLPTDTFSAGDLIVLDDTILFSTTSQRLLTIDRESGEVLDSADHGLDALFGLHATDRLYGYSGDQVYTIDPDSGAAAERADLDIAGTVFGVGTLPSRSVRGTQEDDALFAVFGGVTVSGKDGRDTIEASDEGNRLVGGGGKDQLLGGSGRDRLEGGGRADRLSGGGGADSLKGNGGDDELYGGGGKDKLFGGPGLDTLKGGGGADRFIFKSVEDAGVGRDRDVILDFGRGRDRIDLSDVDADALRAGDQDFASIAGKRFTGTVGELVFKSEKLRGDVDGDERADFEIALSGVSELSSEDLLL